VELLSVNEKKKMDGRGRHTGDDAVERVEKGGNWRARRESTWDEREAGKEGAN
jgi:hypothetical protein